MFTLAAAMYGGESEESVDEQRLVLQLVTEADADWQAVWKDHRGAVLYVLECVATVPGCWGWPQGGALIRAVQDLAVRERAEAVPLRNGLSFTVVETFVDQACMSLAACNREAATAHADQALSDWLGTAERLLGGSWAAACAWAARPAPDSSLGDAGPRLLGVPFETVCPGPWRAGVEQLAREFRAATRLDVTLYDSAPLVVPLCALACASGREVSADALHLRPDETWPELLTRVYDLAGIATAGVDRAGVE